MTSDSWSIPFEKHMKDCLVRVHAHIGLRDIKKVYGIWNRSIGRADILDPEQALLDLVNAKPCRCPAPAPSQGAPEEQEFFAAAADEAMRASQEWPDEEIYHRLAALAGEVGELAEGVIKNRPDVEHEAIQVAACAFRAWRSIRASAVSRGPGPMEAEENER